MKRYAKLLAVLIACGCLAVVTPPVNANDLPAVPGQFMVKFKPGTTEAQRKAAFASQGAQVVDRIPQLDVYVVEIEHLKENPTVGDLKITAQKVASEAGVEYAEPNYTTQLDSAGTFSIPFIPRPWTPNDTDLSQQWAWNVISAPQGWGYSRGSTATEIAIIDSGVQMDHPDLDDKLVPGHDYIDNDNDPVDGLGHGTHVAGTAAAETNNSQGVAGTCPNCSLMPLRVFDDFGGGGTHARIASAITQAADDGARVINLSLGGSGDTNTLKSAVDYAWNKGVFLSCSAGNNNSDTLQYPGGYEHCFSVAATNSDDTRRFDSNYGNWVEIAAPGNGIYSTTLGSGYRLMSGTSMASPHVAGAAGLLVSRGLSNQAIRDRLCGTADDITGTGTNWECGRLNLLRALFRVMTRPTVDFRKDHIATPPDRVIPPPPHGFPSPIRQPKPPTPPLPCRSEGCPLPPESN